jgi:ligand-binding sensor domain-containing protein/serine phosphatase RsbU (regulator of sigma subunit)
MPDLYEQPKIVEIDLKDGYKINQFSGAEVEVIRNTLGDEVQTGKPHPISPKLIKSSDYIAPEDFKVGSHKKVKAHPNLTILDSLPTKKVMRGDIFQHKGIKRPYKLITKLGETLKTGVLETIRSKVIQNVIPREKVASSPRYKDSYSFNFQYLDIDQGMNSSYVFDIAEDKKGNLWFGTWGGGLSVYDGSSFRYFTKKEGLTNDYIRKVFIDSKGNVWAGMEEGGLCMLEFNQNEGTQIHHFTEAQGLSGMVVYDIHEDEYGGIWIAHEEKGISRVVRSTGNEWQIIRFTTNEGLGSNIISSFQEDIDHNLWIGTLESGLAFIKREDLQKSKIQFYQLTEEDGLSSNYVSSLTKGKIGEIWVGTEDQGITKIKTSYGVSFGTNNLEFSYYNSSNGLSDDLILSVYADMFDRIWIGTDGAGLNCIEETATEVKVSRFNTSHGLPHNAVFHIMEDSESNIWFGTDGGGVVKHDPGSFSHFTEKEGLPYPVVLSIIEDEEMNIWFGTDGGGIAIYDEYEIIHLNEDNGLINNNVWTMTEASDSSIWIGTNGGGVSHLKKNGVGNWYDEMSNAKFINYSEDQGLPSVHIVRVLEDKEGNIWMATWGEGLIKFVENENGDYNYYHYTEESGLTKSVVFTIFQDRDENIWFGSEGGGLSKIFKDENGQEQIIHYSTKEGLGSNHILAISEDKKGNLWIGTEGAGLMYFNQKDQSISSLSIENGLVDDLIWSINEGSYGDLWVSTEKGISRIDTVANELIITNFQKQDGLKAVDFYNNSSAYDISHKLWWGSGKSLTCLDTRNYFEADNQPNVYLNKIEVNELLVDHESFAAINGAKCNGFEELYDFPIGLSLPHDNNHLTFHFSGIDWKAPHKVKYSYMIEGLNSGWSIPKSENKAEYRNLPYGTYTFKVRAIGESQKWSKAYEYTFTIRVPWWHAWWARTLYVLFSIGFILLFVRWRTKQLKSRQKELETEVKNATEEISAQHQMLEESYKEITDSIAYAKRIQNAILPPNELIKEHLREAFILYKPKDVVAGDFYWLEFVKADNSILVAAADCTGHGVPGAMVSVVCNNALNRSVREHGLSDPGKVLDKSREIVLEEFGKSNEEVNDGMDIGLCKLNGLDLSFAGAHNSVWILRNGMSEEFKSTANIRITNYEDEKASIIEIKGNKQPVGRFDHPKPFTTFDFQLKKNDVIYLFSDGIIDQFGGPRGKKLKAKELKRLLLEYKDLKMSDQKQAIESAFEQWKGSLEQIDDVCLIAIRIS